MQYPRKVTLNNPKLKELILERESLVLEGRKKSEEIDNLEAQMESIDAEIQEQEKKVDIKSFHDEAEEITHEYNIAVAKMEAMKQKIYDIMKEVVDPKVTELYDKIKKQKEACETERRKIALKVQKRTDKIVPLTQREMKPYLKNEYEDYNSIEIQHGEVIGTIFNHKEDWEANFKKKAVK